LLQDRYFVEEQVFYMVKEKWSPFASHTDFATIKVETKEGLTTVKPSLSYNLCKKIERVGWMPSYEDTILN